MVAVKIGGQPPQTHNETVSFNDKMLDLAQSLFLEELFDETLVACGADFTSRTAGRYGLYETLEGEIVSFQPKAHLKFKVVADDFVATDDLATIKMATYHLGDYELCMA